MKELREKARNKLHNVIGKVASSEWYKDKDFFKPYIRRKNIFQEKVDVLNIIINVLENLFGYDRFHIHFNIADTQNYNNSTDIIPQFSIKNLCIIIHYPNLTVVDDNGNKTTVHNHFQEVDLNFYGVPKKEIYGLTTNPTFAQYLAGYIHSHVQLTSWNDDTFIKYCTGTGTEFHQLRLELTNDELNEDVWTLFFLNMITIAQTESTGTVPYFKLERLAFGNRLDPQHAEQIGINRYINKYDEHDHTPVNWTMRKGKPYVKDDEDLEYHCTEFLDDEFQMDNSNYYVFKDDSGNYFETKSNTLDDLEDKQWSFRNFKGKEFKFKVLDAPEDISEVQYFIHPKIKNYVKELLQREAVSKLLIKAIHE